MKRAMTRVGDLNNKDAVLRSMMIITIIIFRFSIRAKKTSEALKAGEDNHHNYVYVLNER